MQISYPDCDSLTFDTYMFGHAQRVNCKTQWKCCPVAMLVLISVCHGEAYTSAFYSPRFFLFLISETKQSSKAIEANYDEPMNNYITKWKQLLEEVGASA